MLRNQRKHKFLGHLLPLIKQQRLIQQQHTVLYNKASNTLRQGKIMGKLFGHRVSGSKKRWFPSVTDTVHTSDHKLMFKHLPNGKISNRGENDTRRMVVLNKLFMKHITDLMATGEISDSILGKSLQVSRVKISPDFAYVNVFWMSSGDISKDAIMEHELQRCSGLLRHELSQLDLMGVVPRIKFVKDKHFANMSEVEALLRNMDFGPDKEDQDKTYFQSEFQDKALKQEFYGSKTSNIMTSKRDLRKKESLENFDTDVPEMRHDVLGLDHKGIVHKILTKMRKSKQAWDQHYQNKSTVMNNSHSAENSATIPSTTFTELARVNEKIAKEAENTKKFNEFLAKRKERRNTPERKKFRASDHIIDDGYELDQQDFSEPTISTQQSQSHHAEDFLLDDIENRKPN